MNQVKLYQAYPLNCHSNDFSYQLIDSIRFGKCAQLTPENALIHTKQPAPQDQGFGACHGLSEQLFSISVWVKFSQNDACLTFADENIKLSINQLSLSDITTSLTLQQDIWYHLCLVRQQQTDTIYLDGKPVLENKTKTIDNHKLIDFHCANGIVKLANLHLYRRALSLAEVMTDMFAKAHNGQSAFTEQYPLDMKLVNLAKSNYSQQADNQIYIVNTTDQQQVNQQLVINNVSNTNINFISLEQPLSSDNYHLALKFKSGVFAQTEQHVSLTTPNNQWQISAAPIHNLLDDTWSIYLKSTQRHQLAPGDSLVLNLSYLTADSHKGARSSVIHLDYKNSQFNQGEIISGHRSRRIDIVDLSLNNQLSQQVNQLVAKSQQVNEPFSYLDHNQTIVTRSVTELIDHALLTTTELAQQALSQLNLTIETEIAQSFSPGYEMKLTHEYIAWLSEDQQKNNNDSRFKRYQSMLKKITTIRDKQQALANKIKALITTLAKQ